MSGSTLRAWVATYSKTHTFVFAVPDDMAVFAGL
jgi:hypothetical protein